MAQELSGLSALRDRPAGTIGIYAGEHPAVSVLPLALARLLPAYPDIQVEIIVDYGLSDIVAEGLDAGVRLGEQVARDMIALPISPEMRMAVVGAPGYFATHPQLSDPQDLTGHNGINLRLPTYGGLFAWELEKDGRELRVRVEGQLVFNNAALRLQSVLDGLGWPAGRRIRRSSTSAEASSFVSWRRGVRCFRAIISTTRAVATPPPPSVSSSTRFALKLGAAHDTAKQDHATARFCSSQLQTGQAACPAVQ